MGFLSEESIAFFNEFYGNQMSEKPMAQQKLYTEEQVREILKSTHIHTDNDVDMILPQFTPIELPSDEEINKKAYNWCQVEHDEDRCIRAGDDYDIKEMPAFIGGAKWIIDKILNQNK